MKKVKEKKILKKKKKKKTRDCAIEDQLLADFRFFGVCCEILFEEKSYIMLLECLQPCETLALCGITK